jgi:hypothetical protein
MNGMDAWMNLVTLVTCYFDFPNLLLTSTISSRFLSFSKDNFAARDCFHTFFNLLFAEQTSLPFIAIFQKAQSCSAYYFHRLSSALYCWGLSIKPWHGSQLSLLKSIVVFSLFVQSEFRDFAYSKAQISSTKSCINILLLTKEPLYFREKCMKNY